MTCKDCPCYNCVEANECIHCTTCNMGEGNPKVDCIPRINVEFPIKAKNWLSLTKKQKSHFTLVMWSKYHCSWCGDRVHVGDCDIPSDHLV